MSSLRRSVKRLGLILRKHSPEIMVVAGAVGAVAGTVMACKATTKLEDTLDECKERIEDIEIKYAEDENYTEAEYKKDLTKATVKNAVSVAKLYAPAVAVEAASIGLIFGSHNIMRKRNASLAAAYATLDGMWKKYRGNVIDTFGKDVDRDMRFGEKTETIESKIVDENGKETTVSEAVKVVDDMNDPSSYSDYARFFDESCKSWDECPEYNMTFLKAVQSYCNNILKANGYLFLNDVYKQLGIEPSIAGQSVGWIYDEKNPIGDNYVDFGLYETRRRKNRDFVNGYENVILLDFNVDGDILHDERLKLWRK